MRNIVFFIIGILLLSSTFTVVAGPQILMKKGEIFGNDGIITGSVETQGRCTTMPVPDVKVACGRSFRDYDIEVTNEWGNFKFTNLSYTDSGTKYFLWIPPIQMVFATGIDIIELNDTTTEGSAYFFVYDWRFVNILNLNYRYYSYYS
jgi:hypothetical protein